MTDACTFPVSVVPAGISPAQSTQAWTVWLVQSQLNQYFTVTPFKFSGPVPVLTTWIWGWGLLVVSLVTPLNNCTSRLVLEVAVVEVGVGATGVSVDVGGTGVKVEVGGTGVGVRVAVAVGGTGVEVKVGGTGVRVAVDEAVLIGVLDGVAVNVFVAVEVGGTGV